MPVFNDKYKPISEAALQQIPVTMKAAARWIVWGGNKVPVNGKARVKGTNFLPGADITDSTTWLSFEEAAFLIGQECYLKRNEEYFHVVGIGFVVGDGYFCIDADGGADHGREPVPETVISDLCNKTGSYAEMSISGNGCHVFGQCDFVTEDGKEHYSESKTSFEIEFFTRRKFIAITGNRIPAAAEDISDCSEAARQIYIDYVLTGCNKREEEEKKRREEYRRTAPIDPNDSNQFFLLNYPEILQYSDSSNFRRGGKGTELGPGEYSWIGAVKSMQEIGVPEEAIIDWCRRGSNFKDEKDVLHVLREQKQNSGKSCLGSLVQDAQNHGWKPDPDKLTGEYKANHEAAMLYQKEWEAWAEEHKAESEAKLQNVLSSVGINFKQTDLLKYTWTYNFDGSIATVINKITGEIVYPKNDAGADPVQLHSGETVSGTAEQAKSFLTVSGFDDVEIKPTDYLFFPWFPRGKLVAVQGDSSSSKSTFMYAVGAKVTTGEDLLGIPCEDSGNVMFITIEDDAPDIKIAFLDSGGDIKHLRRITDREQIAKLDLSPAGAKVIDEIIKTENIKLLVLDPLQQFLSGDMNKANETRPQLGRLMNIAAENNICIVFLQHMGKDTTKAALHRGVGSVDIGAATRSILQIVTDPEDDYYKIAFTVKNNTADFHDTQRAIRYQVKDHPDSYNHAKKKRERYHGHAEFVEFIPEYNERLYRKAARKSEEERAEEDLLSFQYGSDPLVLTLRELVSENPQGLFIGTDDLIQKITIVCGRCPYDLTNSKATGINSRIDKLRGLLIDNDGIQIDKLDSGKKPTAYMWKGEITETGTTRVKGFKVTPVKASLDGSQQTKI
ncbi:MAG: AAA family ATPase [Parasporobacterium sp.]|nr:AAA family ATPase [Parasporobacterium sp.]